jgi:hypothetical protein
MNLNKTKKKIENKLNHSISITLELSFVLYMFVACVYSWMNTFSIVN